MGYSCYQPPKSTTAKTSIHNKKTPLAAMFQSENWNFCDLISPIEITPPKN